MNKKQVVASLNQIANELDSNGLYQEANVVTNVMVKISQSDLQYSGSPNYKPNANLTVVPDEQTFNDAIGHIKTLLSMGEKDGAKSIFFDTLEKLEDPAQREKFRNTYYDLTAPAVSPNAPATKPNAPSTPIGKPKPPMSNKPSQPSSKPSMPSKPGSSESSTPKSADGLDRWVNKAENIYNAWGSKGANPNSSAFGLVKDIVDYMTKVKSNLPTTLHGSADTKIKRVQLMLQNIFDSAYNPALAPMPLPYGAMGGYPKKNVNPFETGSRMTGKALDYQARQEGKSY